MLPHQRNGLEALVSVLSCNDDPCYRAGLDRRLKNLSLSIVSSETRTDATDSIAGFCLELNHDLLKIRRTPLFQFWRGLSKQSIPAFW